MVSAWGMPEAQSLRDSAEERLAKDLGRAAAGHDAALFGVEDLSSGGGVNLWLRSGGGCVRFPAADAAAAGGSGLARLAEAAEASWLPATAFATSWSPCSSGLLFSITRVLLGGKAPFVRTRLLGSRVLRPGEALPPQSASLPTWTAVGSSGGVFQQGGAAAGGGDGSSSSSSQQSAGGGGGNQQREECLARLLVSLPVHSGPSSSSTDGSELRVKRDDSKAEAAWRCVQHGVGAWLRQSAALPLGGHSQHCGAEAAAGGGGQGAALLWAVVPSDCQYEVTASDAGVVLLEYALLGRCVQESRHVDDAAADAAADQISSRRRADMSAAASADAQAPPLLASTDAACLSARLALAALLDSYPPAGGSGSVAPNGTLTLCFALSARTPPLTTREAATELPISLTGADAALLAAARGLGLDARVGAVFLANMFDFKHDDDVEVLLPVLPGFRGFMYLINNRNYIEMDSGYFLLGESEFTPGPLALRPNGHAFEPLDRFKERAQVVMVAEECVDTSSAPTFVEAAPALFIRLPRALPPAAAASSPQQQQRPIVTLRPSQNLEALLGAVRDAAEAAAAAAAEAGAAASSEPSKTTPEESAKEDKKGEEEDASGDGDDGGHYNDEEDEDEPPAKRRRM